MNAAVEGRGHIAMVAFRCDQLEDAHSGRYERQNDYVVVFIPTEDGAIIRLSGIERRVYIVQEELFQANVPRGPLPVDVEQRIQAAVSGLAVERA